MTNRDILVANAADSLGLPLATVRPLAEMIVNNILSGPAGTLDPDINAGCDCKALDGVDHALDTVRTLLNEEPLGDVSPQDEVAIRADRDMLLGKVDLIGEWYDSQRTPEEPETADPFDALADLLEAAGLSVVRLS